MSVIRTSLSLISFGFTIFQVFLKLNQEKLVAAGGGIRTFGVFMVVLGSALSASGVAYQLTFMHGLRKERQHMVDQDLVHGESGFPVSMTLVVAVLMMLLGVFAIANMVFRIDGGCMRQRLLNGVTDDEPIPACGSGH